MNALDAILAAARVVEMGMLTYDLASANLAATNRTRMLADGWTDEEIDQVEASHADVVRDGREKTKRELWAWALSLPFADLTRGQGDVE